ncbi:Eip74EF [Trypoxylus dichotomus]
MCNNIFISSQFLTKPKKCYPYFCICFKIIESRSLLKAKRIRSPVGALQRCSGCYKSLCRSTAVAGTQAEGDPSPMSLAMPFIDNDLLWCPDNDGNMVDLSACLQDAASVAVGQQNSATNSAATTSNSGGLGELTQSDLSSLVPSLQEEPEQMGDTEDIFKQLSVPFELDNFLDEINNQVKQEENNNVPAEQSANNSHIPHKSVKYPIAAANPLLAQKLALPTGSQAPLMPSSASNGQMALLIPKVEKDFLLRVSKNDLRTHLVGYYRAINVGSL